MAGRRTPLPIRGRSMALLNLPAPAQIGTADTNDQEAIDTPAEVTA